MHHVPRLHQGAALLDGQLPGEESGRNPAWVNDLSGWDFSGAGGDGSRASDTTSTGFTKEQLYSTASYQEKNLQGIGLDGNDLSGWDFSGQNLANADLYGLDAHERQPERGGGDGGKLR